MTTYYIIRKEPARFQSPLEAYRLGDGVKTRSREGVGVTDAGKVGSTVNCYAFSVLPFAVDYPHKHRKSAGN